MYQPDMVVIGILKKQVDGSLDHHFIGSLIAFEAARRRHFSNPICHGYSREDHREIDVDKIGTTNNIGV